jgi:hypothetical protein
MPAMPLTVPIYTHTPSLTKTGDPYEFQIRANFEVVREHFLSLNYSNVTIAFQNHGGKGTKVSLKQLHSHFMTLLIIYSRIFFALSSPKAYLSGARPLTPTSFRSSPSKAAVCILRGKHAVFR